MMILSFLQIPWVRNLERAWWWFLSAPWNQRFQLKTLAGRSTNHLKAYLFTCLVVDSGFWLRTETSMLMLVFPHSMVAGFQQSFPGESDRSSIIISDLASEVTEPTQMQGQEIKTFLLPPFFRLKPQIWWEECEIHFIKRTCEMEERLGFSHL